MRMNSGSREKLKWMWFKNWNQYCFIAIDILNMECSTMANSPLSVREMKRIWEISSRTFARLCSSITKLRMKSLLNLFIARNDLKYDNSGELWGMVAAKPPVAGGKLEDELHGYAAILHRCMQWLISCRKACLWEGLACFCCEITTL